MAYWPPYGSYLDILRTRTDNREIRVRQRFLFSLLASFYIFDTRRLVGDL